jgi:hypothetical protein
MQQYLIHPEKITTVISKKGECSVFLLFNINMMKILHPTIFSKWWGYCIPKPF